MFKSCVVFALLGIIFLIFPGNSFATNGEFNAEENGYIEQYYLEKEEPVESEEELIDPVLEEQIILETLEEYWIEDLKVSEILANTLQDESVIPVVMSTEQEDKIRAIELIEEIYESLDLEQQELLFSYIDRHYVGTEDPKVEEYLSFLEIERQNLLDTITRTPAIPTEEPPIKGIPLPKPPVVYYSTTPSTTATSSSDYDATATTTASSGYNAAAASNWAYMNYNKYSTNYPKFTGSYGTNCTNFISQAMHVGGGIKKQGDWTISRKNTKYHVINSATQLNYSWKLTDPSPWISVKQFSKFWRPKSTVKGVSNTNYLKSPQNYRNQRVGDIVIFSKGAAGTVTVPTHAMMVTQKPANDYNLAGNSVERQAHPLKTAIKSYSYIEFFRPN